MRRLINRLREICTLNGLRLRAIWLDSGNYENLGNGEKLQGAKLVGQDFGFAIWDMVNYKKYGGKLGFRVLRDLWGSRQLGLRVLGCSIPPNLKIPTTITFKS